MKRWNENKKFIITITFISTLFLVSIFLYVNDVINKTDELIAIETKRSESYYTNILNNYFDKINQIEIYYRTVGKDTLNDIDFDQFGQSLEYDNVAFVSMSIAPDGVISVYYSNDYTDDIVGRDLIHDDRDYVRDAVEYAIDNQVVVINGPFDLIQGNEGIVFRKPVFIDGQFSAIINFVVDYNQLNQLFLSFDSNVVQTGIFDQNNNLLFGNLDYQDNIKTYKFLDYTYSDWRIGIHPNEQYIDHIVMNTIILTSVALILFSIGMVIGVRLYRNTKQLLKDKDELINYDNLTLLPNRRLLKRVITKLMNEKNVFYLGFGDLDNFKNLNDILGHSIGDQYLIDISERLKRLDNKKITTYRWGGDEFIFIIKANKKAEAISIVEQIYDAFRRPISINNNEFNVSMSLGLVKYPDNATNIDGLIQRADIVMYDVKKQSRNSYSFFEDKYLEDLRQAVAFENQLSRYNIEDFKVYLQPIVFTKNQNIFGFEALIRLFDEEGQVVNTSDIIHYYERNGDISLIDKYTFEILCQYSVKLKHKYHKEFSFTFNVSPLTLSDDFVLFVKEKSKQYKINPKHFVMEIIETLGFKDFDESVRLINELKDVGFRLAMDDFGIGYSSLSYITKLPLDLIKIDRTFIQNYEDNEFDRLLILTIKEISKSLNIDILVEGIETNDQLEFIKQIDAKYFQGYIHSKPQSITSIIKLLDSNHKKNS